MERDLLDWSVLRNSLELVMGGLLTLSSCFISVANDADTNVQNRRRQGGGDLCVILCFQGVSGWQAEFGTGPEAGSAHRGRTRMDVANRQDIEQFDRTVGCVSRDGWHR